MNANDFVGLEITVADRKKRLSAADWLCAASIAHEKKYITLVDHADHDLEHYKKLRKESCRNFFYAAMGGLFLAIWANEIMHSHGRKNSFQSLSLQMTMLCSTGLAVYFLCRYYHAELCVARLKVSLSLSHAQTHTHTHAHTRTHTHARTHAQTHTRTHTHTNTHTHTHTYTHTH